MALYVKHENKFYHDNEITSVPYYDLKVEAEGSDFFKFSEYAHAEMPLAIWQVNKISVDALLRVLDLEEEIVENNKVSDREKKVEVLFKRWTNQRNNPVVTTEELLSVGFTELARDRKFIYAHNGTEFWIFNMSEGTRRSVVFDVEAVRLMCDLAGLE